MIQETEILEISPRELAIDVACDFNGDVLYVYIDKVRISITDTLTNGYIDIYGNIKQISFPNRMRLLAFLTYLKEYKNVKLLNEEVINSYYWD
ncbi:hypothetical protein [Bacillus sp. AFS040349]|uniref:hypothetical protein n=1 Tax=Bacillus sp. AFS040349 TaxID=2033502 RepID=UPI000BFD215E|nr:hypothetical protein [Bacillus sp. AFS040349]PGT80583.1 hypothetical protein COD11_20955 [Bacillus sp. AFS040349]